MASTQDQGTLALEKALEDLQKLSSKCVASTMRVHTTAFEDAGSMIDEHIPSEALSNLERALNIYTIEFMRICFIIGQGIGAFNDKQRVLALLEKMRAILNDFKLSDEEIYTEIMSYGGHPGYKDELQLAAFKRGWATCWGTLFKIIEHLALSVDGCTELDLSMITTRTLRHGMDFVDVDTSKEIARICNTMQADAAAEPTEAKELNKKALSCDDNIDDI